ncbi:MAG: RNA methyltransferase [Bacteroidota bacterium]
MRKIKNEELNRLSPAAFAQSTKKPNAVILEDVRSAMNVGSAFRTADAFAIEKICLCGITACPPHREIHKTALGAQDTVDWQQFDNSKTCLEKLKAEGYRIVAVEQADKSVSLQHFKVSKSEKYAFAFGNEVYGLSDWLVQHADIVLEIPQYGTKHSLNISVSIGIILWDYLSKANLF